MNTKQVADLIDLKIYTNEVKAITGAILNDVLKKTLGTGLLISETEDLYTPDVVPFGGGQITVTNGSDQVDGIDTLFTNNTDANGLDNKNYFIFKDSADTWWLAITYGPTSDILLTTQAYHNLTVDATEQLPGEFDGVSGTYDFFVSKYIESAANGQHSNMFIGKAIFNSRDYGARYNIGIGERIFFNDEDNIAIGKNIRIAGAHCLVLGDDNKTAGHSNVLLGRYMDIRGQENVAIGRHITIHDSNTKCGVLSANNVQLDNVNMTNCWFIGFKDEQVGYQDLQDTTLVKKLIMTEAPSNISDNNEILNPEYGVGANYGQVYVDVYGFARVVSAPNSIQDKNEVLEAQASIKNKPTKFGGNPGSYVTMTQGSSAILGVNTNFLNPSVVGVTGVGGFHIQTRIFSNVQNWYVEIDTATSATEATMLNHYNLDSDPFRENPLGATWTYTTRGNFIYAYQNDVYGATSERNILVGLDNLVKSSSNVNIVGRANKSLSSDVNVLGRGHKIDTGSAGSSIIGGNGCKIGQNMPNTTLVGLDGFQATNPQLAGMLVTNKLNLQGIQEFANDAAADAAIPIGTAYTLTGSRIMYVRK